MNFQTLNQYYRWTKTIKVFKLNRWIALNQRILKTWIFKHKINFINELKFINTPRLNRWIKANQNKSKDMNFTTLD